MEYAEADRILSMEGFDSLDPSIVNRESIADKLGTLGGGNHFIEVQVDLESRVWVMIHCGSRGIGSNVCTKYNKLATSLTGHLVPDKNLSFFDFDSEIGQEYYRHMLFCMEFSRTNKSVIHSRVMDAIKAVLGKSLDMRLETSVHVFHNFASVETHFGKDVIVHRKGATPAMVDGLGVIPGSMGTHSYIVKGLGNPDSFFSCSHGAGRAMSRQKAHNSITLSSVNRKMEGIYFDSCKAVIDESPDAYKDIQTVMDAQVLGDSPLVEIVCELSPLISIKDTSEKRERGLKNKDRTCPNGHVFGSDFDLYHECKASFCEEASRNACRHRMKTINSKVEKTNGKDEDCQ
jgi:tRNA-splicing ligase RtcB